MEATISSLDRKAVNESFSIPVSHYSREVILQTKMSDPNLWNPESPSFTEPELVTGITKISGITVSENNKSVLISVSTDGAMKKLTYTFSPEGILKIEYAYALYQW